MSLHLRQFAEADRQALRELFLASRRATFTWLNTEAFTEADFDRATVGELIIVAELNGRISGFASLFADQGFIHHLFVAPTALRLGIGRALLAACRDKTSSPLRLKCLLANHAALQFYLAQGWQVLCNEVGADGPYALLELSPPALKNRPG